MQPYSGELEICAHGELENPQLGIVFQNPDLQLFDPSVRDEILYHVPQPDVNLYHFLLAALDLERYEQAPPLLLSEGEKRRVALATVLMLRPRHGVLLDEPALGLDTYHKSLLLVLRALAATGQVVAFSTHDIELAAQADRLILLGASGIAASARRPSCCARQAYGRRSACVFQIGWKFHAEPGGAPRDVSAGADRGLAFTPD